MDVISETPMLDDTEKLRRQFATYILTHGRQVVSGLDPGVMERVREFASNKIGLCKICFQSAPLKKGTIRTVRGVRSGVCVWDCARDPDKCEYDDVSSTRVLPTSPFFCAQPARYWIRWRSRTVAVCHSHALRIPSSEAEIITRDEWLVSHVLMM